MAKTQIGSNATFISASGLSNTYIGNYFYSYSGAVGVPNVETDLINTQSASGYIKSIMQVSYGPPESDNMTYKIYFNGIIVLQFSMSGSVDSGNWQTMIYHLIIPPYTTVRITAQNTTSTTERIQTAIITGRVYDA